MKSKHYFKDFAKKIKSEYKKYETHLEEAKVPSKHCTHYGKVKMVGSDLRCSCGAGWSGPEVQHLFDLFAKK